MSKTHENRALARRDRSGTRIPVPGILTSEQFLEHLHTERTRVDRSGSPFSLILFTIEGFLTFAQRQRAEMLLTEALVQRTRSCDAKGWHGTHLAVILPYTPKQNAYVLVDPLNDLFHEMLRATAPPISGVLLRCVVHGYPEDDIATLPIS